MPAINACGDGDVGFPKWAGKKWATAANLARTYPSYEGPKSPEEFTEVYQDAVAMGLDGISTLPTDKQARKETPIVAGVLDYFPAAIAAVANVSYVGNKQHNGDQPLHWARGKSMDHADCLVRHLVERGTMDTDGLRHTAKVAWRALALLQEELEREAGAPVPRGAKEEGCQ
jgi:hypothetical protein